MSVTDWFTFSGPGLCLGFRSRGLESSGAGSDLSQLCGPGGLLGSLSFGLSSGKEDPLRGLFCIKRSCFQPTVQHKAVLSKSSSPVWRLCPQRGVMSNLLRDQQEPSCLGGQWPVLFIFFLMPISNLIPDPSRGRILKVRLCTSSG